MTVNYTTLLGLAQPVTGTEANAWGDVVNDQITALVEEAVAGGETIDVTSGDVTLSTTVGAANQARNAILLITGTPGTSRNVVAPTQSKVYLVKNSADAAVVLKGAATTGVTIPVGVEALCFFNGSDFEITGVNGPASSTDNAIARFDSTTGKVIQNSGVTIDDSNNISGVAQLNATTVAATTVNATTADINGGTIDATTVGATTPATGSFTTLAASSTLSVTGAGSIEGLTVGRGAGAVASNTAVGASALAANTTGNENTATGVDALLNNTTGEQNTAIGRQALRNNTTGNENTATGRSALESNTTGGANTATGRDALLSNTTGGNNTASGVNALRNNTTGFCNTASGRDALFSNTTGINNTASGVDALRNNTTGNQNAASGVDALRNNTTGNQNAAFGVNALLFNTTGCFNTATGQGALFSNTTGTFNTATGRDALFSNTTGNFNVALGKSSLTSNTTGSCNTAVGESALGANTTACDNSALGLNALAVSTGGNNIGIGKNAGLTGFSPAGIVNITTESNRIVIGNNSHVCAQIKIAFTATSDCRDKSCFAPLAVGLDFVRALKPTEYQFKAGGRDSTETDGKRRYGFLAQEMMPLEGDNPVIISADDPDKLQYTEAHLIPVLVKAIQELTARLEQLENA